MFKKRTDFGRRTSFSYWYGIDRKVTIYRKEEVLEEEIKVLQARESRYEKQIRALKNLRGNLKQQPELYEQVNDKIKESEAGIRNVQTAIYDLRREGQQK